MSDRINIIASTAMYNTQLNVTKNYRNKVINKIVDLYNNKKTKSPDHWVGTVQSTHGVQDLADTYKQFMDEIAPHVEEYLKIYKIEAPFELRFSDLWFNINKKNDYQEFHVHKMSHISGVYYVKVPKDSGDIMFSGINNMFPLKSNNPTIYHNLGYVHKPVDDNLILFPSNLQHMVTQSKSDDLRISLAFNIEVI